MRRVLLTLALFSALAIAFAPQVWLDFAYTGTHVSWPVAIGRSLIDWWLWAIATPLVFLFERRRPLIRGRRIVSGLCHAASGVMLAVVVVVLQLQLSRWLLGLSRQPSSSLRLYLAIATYGAIVAAASAIRAWQGHRDRELHTTQLERALAEAQLDALKARLAPHFLFNTLNGIAALIHEEPDRADEMLTRLSQLLRHVLEHAGADQSRLDEELQLLAMYLDIERMRFGDRLTTRVDIDPAALGALVPSFVLQPIVENAMTHGVSRIPGPASVTVDAHLDGDRLVVTVDDDGPGPADTAVARDGLGTTARRLQHLYGDAASITLSRRSPGGARARLIIPVRWAHTP
jgi:sensor histidine kinase YesM